MKIHLFILLVALIIRLVVIVRFDFFPAASVQLLLGLLDVYLIGLIAKKLTRSNEVGLFASLILAFCPWHIYLVTQDLVFSLLLTTSIITFLLHQFLRKSLRILLLIIILAGCLSYSFYNNIYVLTQAPVWLVNQQRTEHATHDDWAAQLLHNKVINYTLSFVEHYLEHFSVRYLLVDGDGQLKIRAYDFGLLYMSDLFWIVIGLLRVVKNPSSYRYLLVWLAIAPVLSAIRLQPQSALLSSFMIAPITIISAIGINEACIVLNDKRRKKQLLFFALVLIAFVLLNIGYFFHNYFFHTIR